MTFLQDDVELPKLVTFGDDEDDKVQIPPMVKKMSVASPEQDEVAIEFVKAYYGIFDSDSRQNLMEAYHEDALMSMSAAFPAYTQVQSKG